MGVENNIPDGWVETSIGKVTVVESGGTPSTKNSSYWDDEIPWITPRDLSSFNGVFIEKGERGISVEGLENSSAKLLPKNTILFSSRAPIGYVAIAQNETATNQGFKNLICDEVNSHFKYFYYLMKYKANFIERLSSGSTFSEASGALIKSIELNLPLLPEQKAIAKVLTAFDDKIELLQAQNKTLETIAQTIFKEWFGKYKIGDELPKGWKVKPVESFLDFLEGPGIRNWQYTEEGNRFINIRLIKDGDILVNNANCVSNEEANGKYSHFQLEENDFVLSTSGSLGKGAIVRKDHLPLLLNTSVIRFRPKDEMSYSYMYQFLQSKSFLHELISLASGSVQLNFGPMHLKKIKIIVPDDVSLLNYANSVNPCYKKIKYNYTQIQSLTKTRDTLLPKLMSGQVRVNNLKQTTNA